MLDSEIEKIKEQTKAQWNNTPCGQIGDITYTLDYFENVEKYRYEEYAPWMKNYFEYDKQKGKKLLEVGFGQGTDLIQYAKGGADVYGIDLTPHHFDLASLNFKLRNLNANLTLGDASKLPYENNFFDKVSSFGVLHHTPDIEKCVDEVFRVLKPNGEFIIGLYYKDSFFHYWTKCFLDGIVKFGFLRLGYDGNLSTLEAGADGKKYKPYIKLFTKKMMRQLLSKFQIDALDIRHLNREDIPLLGKLFTDGMLQKYSTKYGWYILAKCAKK